MSIARPKREIEAEDYPVEEQEDHCLEICFLCWAMFDGVKEAPELKAGKDLFADEIIRKKKGAPVYNQMRWQNAKTKIYDDFVEAISQMHHPKYLYFLFGRIEILRGERLQKVFFLVPEPIRFLKGQALLKDWQDLCIAV